MRLFDIRKRVLSLGSSGKYKLLSAHILWEWYLIIQAGAQCRQPRICQRSLTCRLCNVTSLLQLGRLWLKIIGVICISTSLFYYYLPMEGPRPHWESFPQTCVKSPVYGWHSGWRFYIEFWSSTSSQMKSRAYCSKDFFCSQRFPMRIKTSGSSSAQPIHLRIGSGLDQVSVIKVRVMHQALPASGCNHTHLTS